MAATLGSVATEGPVRRSQRGRGDRPRQNDAPPLLPPNEITLCTEVYGELPFESQSAPLLTPEPPLPSPHFEKSGYAPEKANCFKTTRIFKSFKSQI